MSIQLASCSLDVRYLESIRWEFKIPANIILLAPEEHKRACSPPLGKVAFNRAIQKVIAGVPFYTLLAQFLHRLGCVPTQLVHIVY